MQLKRLSIRLIKILGILCAIVYPIAIFVALQHDFSARFLGLFLVFVMIVALTRHKSIWMCIGGLVLAALAFVSNHAIFLKLYPVFMNAAICVMFAVSLNNVPLVQKFAQKMGYNITDESKQYARKVTIAWTIFMAINTIISIVTVFMPDWVWTLYNGLVSYCLIGLMMAVEYFVRMGRIHGHK